MRFVFLLTLASFLFISCSKNDSSLTPPPDPIISQLVDSLTAGWQVKQIDTTQKSLTDIFFTNASTGFTCGYQKTLFKTTDGGVTWQRVVMSAGDTYINMQFLNNQYGFIASSGGSPGGGILRTSDGGNTWQFATNASPIDVFFINPTIGFFTHQNGLMKSTDSGKTWISIPGNFSRLQTISFINATKGFVMSGASGIMKTLDGGTSFTTAVSGNYDSYMPIYFANATNGCAGIGKNLYTTNDGGTNWSLVKQFSKSVSDVKNTGANEYYVITGNEIWHSTDGGANWIMEVQLRSDFLAELTLTQSGHVWAAAEHGKLCYK